MNDESNRLPDQDQPRPTSASATESRRSSTVVRMTRRIAYWIVLLVQPVIFVVAILMLIVAFTIAQKIGFFTSASESGGEVVVARPAAFVALIQALDD